MLFFAYPPDGHLTHRVSF